MRPNDYIIIIDEESPQQRVNHTGEKHSKRNAPSRTHYVAVLDEVKQVTGKKVKLKKDRDAEFEDNGDETEQSRAKRVAKNEPKRKAYLASPAFFPLPKGLQATINWVSLDDATLTAIKQYDKGVRESRGKVVG